MRGLLGVAATALALGGGCYTGVDDKVGAAEDAGDDVGDDSDDDDDDSDDDDDDDDDEPVEPVDDETLARIGESGLRRLTAVEYAATVEDVFGVDVNAALLLPEDRRLPFDNDYTEQEPSPALIDAAELLSSDIAALVIEDPANYASVVGCEPESPTDEQCFRSFVETIGRRALRRPLTGDESDRYTALIVEAQETGIFADAVEVALRAFLQHPEFLYRVEVGTQVAEDDMVYVLDDFEVATRLSYFIWGSAPSDDLLDRAQAGDLSDAAGVAEAAEDMLLDPRARERLARFHSMWLGYEQLQHGPDLASAMQGESQALIDRVVFDESGPWQDLLRATDTFVDAGLAEHYGLSAPAGGEGWVDYADSGRQGLLSHGSFLSAMSKIDDSSPTKRGVLVRTRLLCQTIPPPPPEVDVDNSEPPEGTCKEEFYRTAHSQGSCAGCHSLMDPIGLGLEHYDHTGAYREVENDDPSCVISGEGDLDGTPFSGPAELSDILLEQQGLNRCVVRQLYRFAMGRSELEMIDEEFVTVLTDAAAPEGDFEMAPLIVAFVSDDAFRYRRNAELEGGE